MFNRPNSPWSEQEPQDNAGWSVDRSPYLRFILLWVSMTIPLVGIGGRTAQLQLNLQDDFAATFSKTKEQTEEIPAFTGRILSVDGLELATDVQTYDIAVHYRAIQDPFDEAWIESRARPRLSKKDRRDKKKLADEKTCVVEETKLFWQELASLTQHSTDEILNSRRKIQLRIQKIKDSIQRKRRETSEKSDDIQKPDPQIGIGAILMSWLRKNATQNRAERYDEIEEEKQFHTVITDVNADIKDEIISSLRFPHAKIVVHSRRIYPQHELASHLLGHRKAITEEEIHKRKIQFPNGDPSDYRVGDACGLSGIERQYDAILKGIRGQRVLIKNHRGEIIEKREARPPSHGKDLVLQLDTTLQRRAEQLLDDSMKKVTLPEHNDSEASRKTYRAPTCPSGGAIILMDVHTGAVPVAASGPRYDNNLLVTPDRERWNDLMEDKRQPLFSRAINMKLTPGSVFKVITAVAAMESGAMPPNAVCHCRGYLDSPDKPHRCYTFLHQGVGHGDVALTDALCRSCNVYFYTAARRMGPRPIVEWAREFGIGQKTGIDLPLENAGHMPSPDLPQTPWRNGDTLDLAIGQSTLEVTPLQMARVMAAIANGGHLVTPHLAASSNPTSIVESDSTSNQLNSIESHPIPGLHPGTLEHIRKGMEMVVHDPHGTAYKTVKINQIKIAGKTGTAQTNGVDHAWFAGYVPAERPRFAFVVVLEHGGSGGKAAGPIAHDFVQSLLDFDVLKPTALAADRKTTRR